MAKVVEEGHRALQAMQLLLGHRGKSPIHSGTLHKVKIHATASLVPLDGILTQTCGEWQWIEGPQAATELALCPPSHKQRAIHGSVFKYQDDPLLFSGILKIIHNVTIEIIDQS